ncbi:hypothetical protein [Novosphingobium rosa]|uniref:hypothetical protein n=1 Tax=Novosphingobium rosa TaxID=76978 RepID=UPI001470F78C|nr:hypothetical protein [Novosphingobium rosa]
MMLCTQGRMPTGPTGACRILTKPINSMAQIHIRITRSSRVSSVWIALALRRSRMRSQSQLIFIRMSDQPFRRAEVFKAMSNYFILEET